MEPRQHQRISRTVDGQESQRRLAGRVDAGVDLRVERLIELLRAGDRSPAHGRPRPTGPARRPVQLAPRERAPQPRRRPRTELQESLDASTHALGIDRPVAMDDENGVVARADAARRMQRHEDKIGAAKGEATIRYERPLRRQM